MTAAPSCCIRQRPSQPDSRLELAEPRQLIVHRLAVHIGHELCHLLHDRSFGSRLVIVSGPWAPRAIEQRANAFAAWLLMPPSLVTLAIAETVLGSILDRASRRLQPGCS